MKNSNLNRTLSTNGKERLQQTLGAPLSNASGAGGKKAMGRTMSHGQRATNHDTADFDGTGDDGDFGNGESDYDVLSRARKPSGNDTPASGNAKSSNYGGLSNRSAAGNKTTRGFNSNAVRATRPLGNTGNTPNDGGAVLPTNAARRDSSTGAMTRNGNPAAANRRLPSEQRRRDSARAAGQRDVGSLQRPPSEQRRLAAISGAGTRLPSRGREGDGFGQTGPGGNSNRQRSAGRSKVGAGSPYTKIGNKYGASGFGNEIGSANDGYGGGYGGEY